MIKNYLKIAWRNLMNSKGYSAINIGGLAVGMAVVMLIGLWVYDELTFNRYHGNFNRIAQVMQHGNFNGKIETQAGNPGEMGPELRARYGSDFKHVVQASWMESHLFSVEDRHFTKLGMFFESDAPEMLTLNMRQGTRAGLKDPYSILLSASTAQALFGNENPLQKTIKLDRDIDIKVTGVYEDLPYNTTFRDLQFIMSWELWLIKNPWTKLAVDPWGDSFSQTYVQIADHAEMESISTKIKTTKLDNISDRGKRHQWTVFLHPMGKWHLHNEFKNGVNVGGDIQYVKLLGIIGAFVLLLACINFMNLATARSERRAKEIGIRKTLGSFRGQLISRFFAESYLIVLLAFLLSLILVTSVLPSFNEVAEKKIGIPWQNGLFWLFNLLFIFITGLLAGSYPAFYLSSFNPLKVLKGTFRVGRFTSMPRKVLVVFQFAVSVMLIIGTIVIYQQVQHAKSRPLNYEKVGLINLWFEDEIKQHFTTFRHELSNSGAIEELAATLSPLTSVWKNNNDFEWEGKDPNLTVDFANNVVTYEFGETVKWTIINGRDFSRTFGTDSLAFVMNQSAAKFIGFEDPIGKTLTWEGKPFTIIGIVNDMLQESPFFPVRPTLYHIGPDDHHALYNLVIRLNPRQPTSQSLSTMERIWKKYVPDKPFDYSFVDEDFGNKFSDVERIGKLSSYFAVLAVFISCLGLFGMASFVAEQRTKEIAIRKVLGASMANLWLLLSKDFLLLVLLSCIIATPIARQYLSDWLANYDYRITISWTVFALAAVLAIIITLATISVQAIRTAIANPVDSLRDE